MSKNKKEENKKHIRAPVYRGYGGNLANSFFRNSEPRKVVRKRVI